MTIFTVVHPDAENFTFDLISANHYVVADFQVGGVVHGVRVVREYLLDKITPEILNGFGKTNKVKFLYYSHAEQEIQRFLRQHYGARENFFKNFPSQPVCRDSMVSRSGCPKEDVQEKGVV